MTIPVKSKSMKLNFPNQSRSFDVKKNRVRFWGYDSAIEISFFVEAGALQKLSPETGGAEVGCLEAFDATRERIHEVADEAYVRGHKGSYAFVLAAEDF
jgi:hypothetical protein